MAKVKIFILQYGKDQYIQGPIRPILTRHQRKINCLSSGIGEGLLDRTEQEIRRISQTYFLEIVGIFFTCEGSFLV